MKIVVPFKGRATTILAKALRLFPHTLLCLGEDEAMRVLSERRQ
jgi:hypothetical protein